jgi:hypothetical protein
MWYERDFFPRSRPRQARGGIKAQSRSGQFGKTWWAQRWIAVLESFDIGGRLQRGRTYARQGQVLSVQVGKGAVEAQVQGSSPRPYEVAIGVKTLSEAEWKRLLRELSGQQTHGFLDRRASTASQDSAAQGLASAAATRRSSSRMCHSGGVKGASGGRLSQIKSMS